MSVETEHEAFALLLRDHERARASLSADASRAIRRRVATRWTARMGVVAVAGGLGSAALAWPDSATDAMIAVESPIPTPTIGFASATFPLTGGPEFAPASAGLACGDPAPTAHPVDHDLRLTLGEGSTFSLGDEVSSVRAATVQAVVRQVTTTSKGAIATSGVDFLIVRDGIIRGIISGNGVNLAQNIVGGAVSIPQSRLVALGMYCDDARATSQEALAPGSYQVVAIGRMFSTPESVALAQAIGDTINTMYLNPNPNAVDAPVYLPGIYHCTQPRTWGAALRGCLPDITNNAAVDEPAGTVTVVYRSRNLVEEFSTVLVSEPFGIELAAPASATAVAASAAR